ncbi:MAG: hypothetical protein BGO69_10445 [Bacteroidetes bacterium 46-16]|nr:MAG: hypothetical protein BGO69_10445 [Bacteroidetes bacterium 46-16]
MDSVITVPANKVWKIETGSVIGSGNVVLKLNGSEIHDATGAPHTFPIWLPAGSYTLTLANGNNAISASGFISAIEFNLTP